MLNIMIKKVNPFILKSLQYYNSTFTTHIDGWIDIPQHDNIRLNNKDKKVNKYELLQKMKGQSFDIQKVTQNHLFENQLYAGIEFEQIKESQSMEIYQKKNINEKVTNQKIIDEQTMQLFHGNLSKNKVSKFCRTIDAASKMRNSSKIVETISCLFKENQQKQFAQLIKNYIMAQDGSVTDNLSQKPSKAEKQLFKKTQNLFLNSIQQPDSVKELMKIFSQCNPNFIQIQEINKNNDIHKSVDYLNEMKVSKYDLMINQIQQKQKKGIKFIKSNKSVAKNSHNQALDLINSFDKQNTTQNKSKTLAKLKLFVKKEKDNKLLVANQQNLQKVEKSIFGNKKMVTQHIMFKRVQNKQNQKYANYGKNWVYAYDLPYNFNQKQAQEFLCVINDKYGQIQEFSGESYENFVQKNENQVIYVIPQNYGQDNLRNRIKIEKIITKVSNQFQRQNIQQMLASKKKENKSLVTKILEKTQKQKDLALNKSTMVFKFKNYEDKLKFLSPEMRLYGLNLQKMRNIRFQQAQSKNVVALSMVPWACQSADLLKFINDTLIPLKIIVSHPNCIIANGYVFLELSNFYEALYAKDLLNNVIFQNQRLKAQLCYGSSHVYKGEYKFNFQSDHYETLVNKLSGLRDKYKQIHQNQDSHNINFDFKTNLFDKIKQI